METTCEPKIPNRFTLTAGSEEDTLKPSISCMMGLDYVRPLATPRGVLERFWGTKFLLPNW